MKNIIYIDIDSDREQPILIGKGAESPIPQNKEETAKMVQIDINCMAEALVSLIHLADQNAYGEKNELLDRVAGIMEQYRNLPTNNTNENNG